MEKLTIKKLFTPKFPLSKVEWLLMAIFWTYIIILFILNEWFSSSTFKVFEFYIFLFSIFSLPIGYSIGKNHDKIDVWMTRMKHKFSKKSNHLSDINNNF